MNLNLGEHFETMIRRKVESGRYTNASEVVREALRKYERDFDLERLREAVIVSQRQIDAGQLVEWSPALMDEIEIEADEEVRLDKSVDGRDAA